MQRERAIRTSAAGSSGGCLTAVSRRLASYGLGPLDQLSGLASEPEGRYWNGRAVRLDGRDLLIISAYLPPGPEHQQARHDALQDLGHVLKHTRGS